MLFDAILHLFQDLFRILNRVPLGELIDLDDDFALFIDEDGLGGGGAPIEAEITFDHRAGFNRTRFKLGNGVVLFEGRKLFFAGDQGCAGLFTELGFATMRNEFF